MLTRRKICVVTGTRAEYGLLCWLMAGLRDAPDIELQVLVTGAHLSPEFGLTAKVIEQDGFRIDAKVEMLLSSDSSAGVTKSVGVGLIGLADALQRLQPDLLVLLGDRYEILAAAIAALLARVPIAHLHGGELTEGAFDDAIRHAVTKMSQLHFVAADEYRQRVIQLGEDPARVYTVGGLGVDGILRLKLLDRAELERSLDFKLGPRNLLVTYHPVTLGLAGDEAGFRNLLDVLAEQRDTHIIFTMPNADTEGRTLFGMIEQFVAAHPSTSRAFKSLGQLRYLSSIQHCDGVIGNSSSALIEAPALHTGSIDIGDRQKGRLKAASVIECDTSVAGIREALGRLYSQEFRAQLPATVNPYGTGGASERILSVLRSVPLEGLQRKRFHDLTVTPT